MTHHRITIDLDCDSVDAVVTLEDAILSELDDAPVQNVVVAHTFPSGVTLGGYGPTS